MLTFPSLFEGPISDDLKGKILELKKLCMDSKTAIPRFKLDGILKSEFNSFLTKDAEFGDELLFRCSYIEKNDTCFKRVWYMDLVAFKAVNDCFSEAAGDIIIAYVMDFLSEKLSGKDYLLARKGSGDEFLAYKMTDRRCQNPRKAERDDDFLAEQLSAKTDAPELGNENELQDIAEAFQDSKVVLYIPRNTNVPYHFSKGATTDSLDKVLVSEGETPLDKNKSDRYLCRLVITGMEFRYGDGINHREAWSNAKSKNISTRRGDFSEKVRIGILNDDNAVTWIAPNKSMLLIVKGEDDRLVNKLNNILKDGNVFTVKQHKSDDFKATILEISPKVKKSGAEARKENTLDDAKLSLAELESLLDEDMWKNEKNLVKTIKDSIEPISLSPTHSAISSLKKLCELLKALREAAGKPLKKGPLLNDILDILAVKSLNSLHELEKSVIELIQNHASDDPRIRPRLDNTDLQSIYKLSGESIYDLLKER